MKASMAPVVPHLVASTAAELLLRLYSLAYGRRGDFVHTPAATQPAPEGHEEALEWFFADEVALGTNLAVLAATEGWLHPAMMIEALRESPTARTVCALLRPPSATPAEIRRRNHLIRRIVSGQREGSSELVAQCVSDGFEARSVSRLLAEPERGIHELIELVECAAGLFTDEPEVRNRLELRVEELKVQFSETTDLRSELSRVTGGWTLKEPTGYNISLAPCEAIRPYLIQRVSVGDSAVVLFSSSTGGGRDLADLADALKVLGNVQRLTILRIVVELPATGQDLAELLGLSEATVHHHTSALRSTGLITSEREGHRLYHHATAEPLIELVNDLRRVLFEK